MPNDIDLSAGFIDEPPKRRARSGLQPELEEHWNNLQSVFAREGVKPILRSGFRTAEQQNALHRAGKPTKGNDGYINISPHQEGRALDIGNLGEKGKRILADYARQNNLHIPSDEPWHIAIPKQKDSGIDLSAGFTDDTPEPVAQTPTQPVRQKPTQLKPPARLWGQPAPAEQQQVIRRAVGSLPPQSVSPFEPKSPEQQEIIRRAIDAPPDLGPSMQARTPGIIERVKEAVGPYVPGLQSIDTPGGIKTDILRGVASGVTLGAVGDKREITPEERILDPNAGKPLIKTPDLPLVGSLEADAHSLGELGAMVIPYIGASKALSKVPALSRATRASQAARVGTTLGGVTAARETINAVKSGDPIRPEEIAVNTAIGVAMGAIPGLNPSLKKRLFAAVAPQVIADYARGVDPQDATKSALLNVVFEYGSGRKLGLSRKRIGELRAQIETQRRLNAETTENQGRESVAEVRGERGASDAIDPQRPNKTSQAVPGVGLEPGNAASGEGSRQVWQHRDFGKVVASENQASVGRGRVRVVDESGNEHVIKRAKLTGAGNQIAIPVKEPAQSPEMPLKKRAGQTEGLAKNAEAPRGKAKEPWQITPEEYERNVGPYEYERFERVAIGDEGRLSSLNRSGAEWKTYARDNPQLRSNPQTVVVYRATLGKGLNAGDWVYLKRDMARAHLENLADRGEGIKPKIVEREVSLDDIVAGQDSEEFIYSPRRATERPHSEHVRVALLEGKPVPPEVLAKYPHLAAKLLKPETTRNEAVPAIPVREPATSEPARGLPAETATKALPEEGARLPESTPSTSEISRREVVQPSNPELKGGKNEPQKALAEGIEARESTKSILSKAGPVKTQVPGPEPSRMKVRATPKTLERHGLEGGTDRLYEEQTNVEQLRAADATIDKHGIDASIEIAKRSGDSGEQTAMGISLVRKLQDAGKHGQAVDVASDLARRLTKAGQTVQAVNVVSRLSPERQVLTAQKIVQAKNPNAKLRPAQAEAITKHATKLEDAIARIATLEARIEEIKLQPKVGVRKPKLETLNDRLLKAEQEARVRLAQRAELMKVGGPERGASAIPADIADYAIIGASKLARKGVTFASWSAEMTREFGDEIKPKLRAIYRASYSTLNNERKSMREGTEQRLARKEMEGPVRPEDLGKLVEQRRQAQRDARAARYSLARTFNYLERGRAGQVLDVATDVANVPRTLMSSLDLSAPLRQGGFFSVTETKVSGKAAKDMITAISEKGYDKVLDEIKDHPDYNLAKRAGIEFTEVGRDDFNLSHTEEAYLSKIAGRLPVIKQSQQAYVAFLDSQRMQVFSKFANELRGQGRTMDSHPEAFKYIAKFVNAGTGRGTLGRKGNQIAPYLNAVFFSPRYLASRVQLINMAANPVAWARMPEGARGIIMRKNVRFASTVGTALGLAAMAGAKVSMDFDDADFLKVQAWDTRYDILAGFQQPLRFILRFGNAVRADLMKDETYAGEGKQDLITRFARSKEAPGFSFLNDYISGEDYMGRKFDLGAKSLDNPIISRVLPMMAKDMAKAMNEEGLIGAAKTSPAFFGLGVQTYKSAPEEAKTKAEKLTRAMIRRKMPGDARTQEEMDKSRKVSELRARSRKGEDVSKELGGLTTRQSNAITNAKNTTRLQEDFKRLPIKEALTAYGTMSQSEKDSVKQILETKSASIFDLPPDEQAELKKKLEAIGMSPGIIRRQPRQRIERQERRPRGQGYIFR